MLPSIRRWSSTAAARLSRASDIRARIRPFEPPAAAPPSRAETERLVEFFEQHKGRVLALTGAGVSTESGIPDYRSPKGSYSTGHKPVTHQEFLKDLRKRKRYWARSVLGWSHFDLLRPSFPHHALARLQSEGWTSRGLVTQNVDMLHERAGFDGVLHLHGGNAHVVCQSCGYRGKRREYQDRLVVLNREWIHQHIVSAAAAPNDDDARYDVDKTQQHAHADGDAELAAADATDTFRVAPCPKCDQGIVKPDVVFFGGNIQREIKDQAAQMVTDASGIVVLGSSCQVFSVYRLCMQARDQGTPIAIVNIGDTRADPLADFKVQGQCGSVLGAVCDALGVPVHVAG